MRQIYYKNGLFRYTLWGRICRFFRKKPTEYMD